MNTWQIIKTELTRDSRAGTLGRSVDINLASDLFLKLLPHIKDEDEAKASFNLGEEVREALLNRRGIKELQAAGIIP